MFKQVLFLKKHAIKRLGDFLDATEIQCQCNRDDCTFTQISELVIDAFNDLRAEVGEPLHINSGYRCQIHNQEVGGKVDSHHVKGFAIDIRVPKNWPIQRMYLLAIKYFDVVVPYPNEEFIHCQIHPWEN